MKHLNRIIILALFLGCLLDFLFWGRPLGINFALFMLLCLLGLSYLLFGEGYRPAQKSLFLLIPLAFFSAVAFVRQEPLTISLAYTFTLFSFVLITTSYLGGRWIQYGLADYFEKLFQLIFNMTTGTLRAFQRAREELVNSGEAEPKILIVPVLRGLLIALPIVACFASLLGSSDAIFNQKMIEFFESLDLDASHVLRFVLIPMYAYLLAGVFFHAALRSADEKLLGEEEPRIKRFLGFTEAAIVLGSVTALFLIFVLIQFQYFFGGQANIGVAGFTYSQYARRGFSELISVACLSLLMILGLSTVTRRENDLQRRIYSGLSVLTVALVLVILVSAYQRLMLAIGWHGFSRLRLYPSVFLIWLGLLLVTVVLLEVFHLERFFAFAAVLTSLGFAASLAFINIDSSIVEYNIRRASLGWHLNVPHLASLSSDAIPALVEEYHNPTLPIEVHEGVGAALLCYMRSDSMDQHESSDWRSFTFSSWKAEQALKLVEGEFDGYRKWSMWVRTPGNKTYDCTE